MTIQFILSFNANKICFLNVVKQHAKLACNNIINAAGNGIQTADPQVESSLS